MKTRKPVITVAQPLSSAPALRANADTNGDGRTDFLIARAAGPVRNFGEASNISAPNRGAASIRQRLRIDKEQPSYDNVTGLGIEWWAGQQTGSHIVHQLGNSDSDFVVMEDFDGDGKDDFAVWRPGLSGTAKFIILESSTGTIREEFFGLTGDDPAVVGDYDGDGKADPATFRCPVDAPGQCFFFYRGSLNNPSRGITYVPWGYGIDGDLYANPGDFDGDGKNDFCVQRKAPGTNTVGQFVLFRSSDSGIEYINWGNSDDFIIPGDYDGDGKSDFCVRQTFDNGLHYYWVLTRTGGVNVVQWGKNGDESAPGDYDGDGKQDFAVWREDLSNPYNNNFWVRKSSTGGVMVSAWGYGYDYPAANWYVH